MNTKLKGSLMVTFLCLRRRNPHICPVNPSCTINALLKTLYFFFIPAIVEIRRSLFQMLVSSFIYSISKYLSSVCDGPGSVLQKQERNDEKHKTGPSLIKIMV